MKLVNILAGIFVFALITLALSINTAAEETTDSEYKYRVLKDKTIKLTDYMGNSAEVEIPSEIDGYKVVSIGNEAFYKNTAIEKVIIPEGVISVDEGYNNLDNDVHGAFCGCISLVDVELPQSVLNIGSYSFMNCEKLNKITLPDNLTEIGISAFNGCKSLCNINIPSKITYIKQDAFKGTAMIKAQAEGVKYAGDWVVECDKEATEAMIKEDTRGIACYSFKNCEKIKNASIPDTVVYIGEGAFYGCSSLEKIDIPDGVDKVERVSFIDCISLAEVNIPSSVTEIGVSAFTNCTSLTSVTIPNGVKEMYDNVFAGCSSLRSVSIPKSVEAIVFDAFRRCPMLTVIYCREEKDNLVFHPGVFPQKATVYYDCDPVYSDLFEFADKNGEISAVLFKGDKSAVIPKTADGKPVKKIERTAFCKNSQIQTVFIPKCIDEICDNAFNGCDSLVKIYYEGTEEQWKSVKKGKGNKILLSAEVIYGAKETDISGIDELQSDEETIHFYIALITVISVLGISSVVFIVLKKRKKTGV